MVILCLNIMDILLKKKLKNKLFEVNKLLNNGLNIFNAGKVPLISQNEAI